VTRDGKEASFNAAAAPAEERVLARWGWAGKNHSLFDHPADSLHIVCDFAPSVFSETPKHFSTTCQLG
jgi:hypothetical protein